jgi:hypothetical protein
VRVIRADRDTDSTFRIWLDDRAFVPWGDWRYLKSMVQTDRDGIEDAKSVKLYHAFLGTPMVVIEMEEA